MRLRHALGAAVLAASSAFGGWSAVPIAGQARDVSVARASVDGGVIVVASSVEARAYLCSPDGGSSAASLSLSGDSISAAADPLLGCIAAVPFVMGAVVYASCYDGGLALPAAEATTGEKKLRIGSSGFTAVHIGATSGKSGLSWASSPGSPFSTQLTALGSDMGHSSLSLVNLGGVDVAAIDTTAAGQPVALFVDGGPAVAVTGSQIMTSADSLIFVRADGGLGLFISTGAAMSTALELGGVDLAGSFGPTAVNNSTGGALASLSYSESVATLHGRGFGMARYTMGNLAGPVPNPSAPGQAWVPRSGPGAGAVSNVTCESAFFCAAVATGGSVWAYWNEAAPTGNVMVSTSAPYSATAQVGDGDGDPIYVTWELDGGGAYTVTPGNAIDGTTATLTPTRCTPSVTVTAYASDGWHEVALTSSPVTLSGTPTPAFASSTTTPQLAGRAQRYALDAGEADLCTSLGSTVATHWSVAVDGGPTITWAADDGGITVSSSDFCASGSVSGTVSYSIGGQQGPTTAFDIGIVADPSAALRDGGTFSISSVAFDGGCAVGAFHITACPGSTFLGSIDATLVDGGGPLGTGQLMLGDGTQWVLCLPNGCAGDTYRFSANLGVGFASAYQSATAAPTPVGLDVTDRELDVSCQGSVDDSLAAALPAGSCQSVTFSWQQTGGPPSEPTPADRPSHQVVIIDGGFDELVGQTITFDVTVSGGAANTLTRPQRGLLTHRFVELSRTLEPLAADSDDLRTVRVRLSGKDPCASTRLYLTETATGLAPLTGSFRLDGKALTPTRDSDGGYVLGPIAMEPMGVHTVTWLGRQPLFATPALTGRVTLNGADVTAQASAGQPLGPPASCGCSSAGLSVLTLFAALSLWPRRRALSPLRTSRRSGGRSRPS